MKDEELIKSSRTNLPQLVEKEPSSSNNEDKVRLFLARAIIGLMLIALLLTYTIKKDTNLLGTSTALGIAAVLVFKYYFTKDKK